MSEAREKADRVAAELVTQGLGGSVSNAIYEHVVEVVAVAYMRGQLAGRDEILEAWNEQLERWEAS